MKYFVAGIVIVGCTLAGCGGGGSGGDGTSGAQQPDSGTAGNRAPTIYGTPATSVAAGRSYSFKPQASDPDGDRVTFTIANKPAWATFDAATGTLSGTPAASHVGSYPAIEIAATDGKAVSTLPAFTLTVSSSDGGNASGSVAIAWDPPTTNDDGTPLADLRGYNIHIGTAPKAYDRVVSVDNPSVTRFVLDGLASGTHYVAVTAYNGAGIESGFSPEVSVRVN